MYVYQAFLKPFKSCL